MGNTLKIKRNQTYNQQLKPSSLAYGELAYYNFATVFILA